MCLIIIYDTMSNEDAHTITITPQNSQSNNGNLEGNNQPSTQLLQQLELLLQGQHNINIPRGGGGQDIINGGGVVRAESEGSYLGTKKYNDIQKIFRMATFFLFCSAILGITTALRFEDKMNTDQLLNVVSSLLFLLSPSPLDFLQKKKKK